jgi:putative addiction module CopG family antidote
MTIHLNPEPEALIREDVERGPYQSADEYVAQAVQMLHAHEQWLAENRADIAAKIEVGFAQAERGELSDPHQVRARLNERKQDWMDQNQRE